MLHQRAFRETSVVVDLLTHDFGRISGVVRAAKSTGRRTRQIDPFCELAVTWRGRGQLVNVLHCEPVTSCRLAGERLFCGLYLNELLVKTLSQEEPVAALFQHYRETLSALHADDHSSAAGIEGSLRNFERRLLEELGYGMMFDVDVRSGRPITPESNYAVVPGEGFTEFDNAAGSRDGSSALLVSAQQIEAMASGDYSDVNVRRTAKRVFRQALQKRLGHRRLATRALFQARSDSSRDIDHG